MKFEPANFDLKFGLFTDLWSPKIVGKVDNYYIKFAKIKGHFTWHKHDDADEVFIVNKGEMQIDFRDGKVNLKKGDMYIVPKNKEHKPYAEEVCEIILFEKSDVVNTGNVIDKFTVENLEMI